MDFQNRVGSKTGGGGVSGWSESNRDRRERLRKLALETIDLNKVRLVVFRSSVRSFLFLVLWSEMKCVLCTSNTISILSLTPCACVRACVYIRTCVWICAMRVVPSLLFYICMHVSE